MRRLFTGGIQLQTPSVKWRGHCACYGSHGGRGGTVAYRDGHTAIHTGQCRYCELSDCWSTFSTDISSCLPFHKHALRLLFTFSVALWLLREQITTAQGEIKQTSAREQGKGIKKNVATLEEHNPKRGICKIKDPGIGEAWISTQVLSFRLIKKKPLLHKQMM